MRSAIIFVALAALAVSTYAQVAEQVHPIKPLDEKIAGGMLCSVCVKLVEGGVGKGGDALKTYLEKEIASLCKNLGMFLAGVCKTELNNLVGTIIELLSESADAREICTKIKCC